MSPASIVNSLLEKLPPKWRYPAHRAALAMGRLVDREEKVRAKAMADISTKRIVAAGPFAGMQYLPVSVGSVLVPKVAGVYEKELYPAVERVIAAEPDVVVDLGSAEGFYVVGMAMRLPAAKVHGFDIDPYARHLTQCLAELNATTDRVTVAGLCDHATLDRLLASADRPAVICDIEGGELDLLDVERVPSLSKTVLLIEAHEIDRDKQSTADIMVDRLQATHDIERIAVQPRERGDVPELANLDDESFFHATNEWRLQVDGWLACWPRND